jgi:hypothetical protein
MKKRKQAENTAAQRHKEKMTKFDEFIKIYKARTSNWEKTVSFIDFINIRYR